MTDDPFFGATEPVKVPAHVGREGEGVGLERGFVDRGPVPRMPKRRRGTSDPIGNFTMRLAIADVEVFVRWCERERISYREAFSRFVATIPQEKSRDVR